jgi:hypothetical protein
LRITITRHTLCLAALLALPGCPDNNNNDMGSADMAVPVPTNFAQIANEILQPTCAGFSSCHSNAGLNDAAKLNLCSAPRPGVTGIDICKSTSSLMGAYNALINQPAANLQAKGEGLVLVKPCDPAHSFIITKLKLPTTAVDKDVGYGEHMPKDSPSLPQAQIDAISDWIARGAHFDEPATVSGSICVPDVDMSAGATDMAHLD